MKSSQVTIKDIARILGISPSTVSRALHNHPDISADTKKQVGDLARQLHYEPNAVAQNLRSKKTYTIGVIIPEIVHFFFSSVISGIEEVAYKEGYSVMFCQTGESYEREVQDTKALINHRVDGLLVSFSKETTNFDHFVDAESRVPLVLFDRETEALNVSRVIVDDYNGSIQACKHLIEQGCKRMAHLAGPENLTIGAERKRGFEAALHQAGMSVNSQYLLPCFTGTMEEGHQCMQRLLSLQEPPDGLFAHNDMAAYGAMKAIKEAGLSIPKDIAVVGFSNWRFSSLIEPQLTTVSQPGIEMGRVAARILIQELANGMEEHEPIREVLKTEFIVRNSSKRK